MTAVDTYKTQAQNVSDEAILGQLIWFTISGADVNLNQAKQEVTNLNLSDQTLRTTIRPVDAFKKAANDIEKKFPRHDDGIQSSFLVRSVGQDSETSHRHVILERAIVKQGKKRKLVYDAVAELVFNRGNKHDDGTYSGYSIDVTRKNPPGVTFTTQEQEWLDAMVGGLKGRFQHNLTHLDSHAIRTFVREYLYMLGGICVKPSGGVYFVQQVHKDELNRLWTFVDNIGSSFHMLPLLDLEEQRDMLLEAFEDETIGEVERLSSELSKILSDPNRNIEQKTWDQKAERSAELLAKAQEYSDLLDRKTERTKLELDMFKQQLLQLATRIK